MHKLNSFKPCSYASYTFQVTYHNTHASTLRKILPTHTAYHTHSPSILHFQLNMSIQ